MTTGSVTVMDAPEIRTAIQNGIDQVNQTFGSLNDQQLDVQVYDGEGGWTSRQVLAHLAGRSAGYDMRINIATTGGDLDRGNFDVNAWNEQTVQDRTGRSRDELLNEFQSVHYGLIERVGTMDPSLLERPIELPNGTRILAETLAGSGGMHSIAHANDVALALELPDGNI